MTEKGVAYKLSESWKKYQDSIGKKPEVVKVAEEGSVEKAQDDPDRICGDIWFNGTDAQRAGFGDGMEGRSRDEKAPKKWWDSCVAKIGGSAEATMQASKETSTQVPLSTADFSDEEKKVLMEKLKTENIKFELKEGEIYVDSSASDKIKEIIVSMFL